MSACRDAQVQHLTRIDISGNKAIELDLCAILCCDNKCKLISIQKSFVNYISSAQFFNRNQLIRHHIAAKASEKRAPFQQIVF